MASRASIAGHPIHPMLVVFPIGLWVFSFICDLIYLGTANPLWWVLAFYTMVGGIIGALAAATFGIIDYTGIRDGDTKRIATTHMALNIAITVLFLINAYWRTQVGPDSLAPLWLSLVAVVLLGVSGWLGGALVYEHGQGVSSDALAQRPASVPVERRRPGGSAVYTGPERRRAPAYVSDTQ